MVNGRISLIVYAGAWFAIMLCLIGFIVLAYNSKEAPAELGIALTAAFGIITGSHIMPPITNKATTSTLEKVNSDLKRRSTDG